MRQRRSVFTMMCACHIMACAWCTDAIAMLSCRPFGDGLELCEAGIDSQVLDVTAQGLGGQHQSQWCWAASVEMVFRYYGYYIPQGTIVQQTWGTIGNMPGQPNDVLRTLNRSWIDANGKAFSVVGDLFSANQVTASQDLLQNKPLIIETMGHTMLLTSLTFTRDQHGQSAVKSATVRDPWPGRGKRVLTPQEWFQASFLARIELFARSGSPQDYDRSFME